MLLTRRGRVVLLVVLLVVLALLTWNLYLGGTFIEYAEPTEQIDTHPAQTTLADETDKQADAGKPDIVSLSTALGPLTVIPEGAYSQGFTLFDSLYLRNGTFYVITRDASKFPPIVDMISAPNELGENVDTTPTGQQMQFLSADDSESMLGKHAIRIEGLSIVVYDPPQFMTHFYHWWGEIVLGAWRILSFEGGKTKELPKPRRFLLPFSAQGKFRDPAGVNAPLMRAAWPSAPIEESDWWEDLITLNATVVFDRVMLINRPAAQRHPLGAQWNKMIAGTMNVAVPDSFWEPLRQAIVTNILGHLPTPPELMTVHDTQQPLPKPLVTYVSRQHARARQLLVKDHEALLAAMKNLEAQGVCEFREARMEEMSLREQVELAARSTIMVGVHGNGLTHQLWMPPSYRSAVFEIFDPEGYLFDYEILARNMEHRHYAVWNDRLVTYPKGTYHDSIKVGDQFNGKNIPVDAETLVNAVKERLAEKMP